ncbi:MAG: RagB/SusD family nutrient uptake outer membrane protein [Bacteroidota bacterium]
MKKKIYNSICAILMFSLIAGTFGCKKFLTEEELPRLTPDYYGTPEGVTAAATATYSFMRWGAGAENYDALNEFGVDLFTQGDDPGGRADAFNKYGSQLNADNGVLYGFWENHYKAISTANLVIKQVEASTTLSEIQKQKALAEMSFLRAFFYFELVQHFGRIPLVMDSSFEVLTDFPRASVADIYSQIIKDLEYAVQYLDEKPADRGKTGKYPAAHLLAKVYLTRGSAVTDQRGQQPTDMANALKYAKMVIDSKQYALIDNFADLWNPANQGNKEVIFSVQFTNNQVYNGNGNTLHLYWTSWYEDLPGMIRDVVYGRPYRRRRQTDRTVSELFDRKNDSRFYKSFRFVLYANKPNGPIPLGDTAVYYSVNPQPAGASYKYRYVGWNKSDPTKNNRYYPPLLKYSDPNRLSTNEVKGSREWVRMRLGETYLIAAEAAGRSGDFTTAAGYINEVRKRASWKQGEVKMPQYWREEGGQKGNLDSTFPFIQATTANISTNFVDVMLDERGRELLGETCRWEDLVRCEKLAQYVQFNPEAKGNFKPYHKLRPIPQKHIDRLSPRGTPAEEQNEGYY